MAKAKKKRAVKKAVRKLRVLPKKLSSLVRLALKDIRAAEKLPEKYIFAMNSSYHEPTEVVCGTASFNHDDEGTITRVIKRQPACLVCAAGAVIAFSLKADFTKNLSPSNMEGNTSQLEAIDYLRQGLVLNAYCEVKGINIWNMPDALENKIHKLDCSIPDYEPENPEPFHKAMLKLEKSLIKAGL